MILILGCANMASNSEKGITPYPKDKAAIKDTLTPINFSENVWKKKLSAEEFEIIRNKGTERAGSGAYDKNYKKGIYHCKACHLPLFDSGDKFDSGTG